MLINADKQIWIEWWVASWMQHILCWMRAEEYRLSCGSQALCSMPFVGNLYFSIVKPYRILREVHLCLMRFGFFFSLSSLIVDWNQIISSIFSDAWFCALNCKCCTTQIHFILCFDITLNNDYANSTTSIFYFIQKYIDVTTVTTLIEPVDTRVRIEIIIFI